MSALPSTATKRRTWRHFAFVPLSDIMATVANIEVNEGGSLEIDLHLHQRQLLRQAPRSIHRNPCARRAVQKPLQVKAGELIIRVLANMGRKRRQRTGIVRFQLGKGVEIAGGRGTPRIVRV